MFQCYKVLRKISYHCSSHINVGTAVRILSALIEIGEFPRSTIWVMVHGNPIIIVFYCPSVLSSNNGERPVSPVDSTAHPESLRVMRDIDIEDVYIAG